MNAELLYAVTEVHSLEDVSTLPRAGNLGIVLKDRQRKPFLIVALELVPTLQSKWGVKLLVKRTFLGSALENCRYCLKLDMYFCSSVLLGKILIVKSQIKFSLNDFVSMHN